jgi:hypothetical protein
VVVRWLPGRDLVLVADSSDAGLDLRHQVSELPRASLITRRRLDATLDDPPPKREPRQQGRPRLKGKRRATLETVLIDDRTPGTMLTVDQWSDAGPREVNGCMASAVWYHAGKPPAPIHWVPIRDPDQSFEPQALLSTNLGPTPEEMLTWSIRRWNIDVTFEEARAHPGIETQYQ